MSPSPQQANSPIRIRWAADPESLDPLALPNQNATDAAILQYVSLLQIDFQTGQYAPALAAQLPTARLLAGSRLQLDYHLRPEATWDDGRPVLGTDVAFTLKLIHCSGLPHEDLRAQVDFIEECRLDPADPRHVTFICHGQAPEYRLASGDFPIISEQPLDPAHTLRPITLAALRAATTPAPAVAALVARYQQANVAHHPERLPGCGPYRLVSWQSNQALLFQRKAHWWADQVRPAPFVLLARARQLQFVILPDAAAATLALQRHELDVFPQVPARAFQRLRASASGPGLQFFTTPSYDVVAVGFNTRQPALRDARTRQALSLLLDPDALQQATQLGQGVRTVGLVPPASPFYHDSLPLLRAAPGRAAQLLRQAGWQRQADGWHRAGQPGPLRLSLHYRADDNTFAAVGLQLRAAAGQLGIPVELRPTEASILTQVLHAGAFEMYVRTIKGNPFVLDFSALLHTRAIGEGNFTQFGRPDTDRLLDSIAATGDFRRKRRLLRKFQVLLRAESPLVPLFFLPNRLVASRQLQHLVVSGLKPGYAAAALSWAPTTHGSPPH